MQAKTYTCLQDTAFYSNHMWKHWLDNHFPTCEGLSISWNILNFSSNKTVGVKHLTPDVKCSTPDYNYSIFAQIHDFVNH